MSSRPTTLIVVPEATHEAVTYYFQDLVPPVLAWLEGKGRQAKTEIRPPKSE